MTCQAFIEQVEGQIKGRQVLEIQSAGDDWVLRERAGSYQTSEFCREEVDCHDGSKMRLKIGCKQVLYR
jgi:hypothetical protein